MITIRINSMLIFFSIMVFLLIGCSKNPMEPPIENNSNFLEHVPDILLTDCSNRSALAVYDAVIDIDNQIFIVTPSQRDVMGHFPLSNMYPNCFQITGFGFTPNFWADIKLTHPLPESGIDAFDPRVIAILPANPGVRFIYPTLYVGGNNRVVLEPDGYTKLFDDPAVLGNVNPFIAYFKDQPYRRWSSTGQTEETKRWQMDIDGFGGAMQFSFVVDVSTNFPSPPTPVTDNAPEPVAVCASAGHGLTPDGGSADINVTLLDWQGIAGIGGVRVESPALFNGTVNLSYSSPGDNPNEYKASGTISNTKLAPAGIYNYMVAAWDQATGIHIYKEFPVTVSEPDTNGNLIWAKRAGSEYQNIGRAITTLSDNSTVVTGYNMGGGTFGEGEENETVLSYFGLYDIFVARYNPDGTLAWAKRAGGSSYDWGYGITSLSDDSIIVTGAFDGTATFGPGEPNQTVLSVFDANAVFVARYNTDGTLAWAKQAGSDNSAATGFSVTALSDDSFVVTGGFRSIAIFGKGEPNETTLSSSGYYDIFIARYNSNGTLVWAKKAGSAGDDYGSSVVALSDNSVVVTGNFEYTTTFGQGEPNQTVLTTYGDKDIFIAKYNANGTLAWAKKAGGLSWDFGQGITKLSDNSVIVTGYFLSSATFGENDPNQTVLTSNGNYDIFIARYDSYGTLSWAKQAGGSSSDMSYAITTLANNNIVITGSFNETSVFGSGEPDEKVLTSAGYNDIFVAQYNPDGMIVYAKSAGSAAWFDEGFGITTLSDDTTIATGAFYSNATFGQGEPNETTLISAGDYDIFIARFEP